MKKLLITFALACVFSGTALAGEMPAVTPAPVPSGTEAPGNVPTSDSPAPGDMLTPGFVLTILGLVF